MINVNNWLTQLHKGFLELSVLMVIAQHKHCYGAQIINALKKHKLTVNEGTLYPLINRMYKNNWLSSHWEKPEDGSHAKRYYQLTESSKRQLPNLIKHYKRTMQTFNSLHKKTI